MSQDQTKVDPDGRYRIVDSFGEEVERTNDYGYAVMRADANDGWIEDEVRHAVIYDSADD